LVKLFGRKKDKSTETFKFDTSLKIKDLPLEEYSHVNFALKTAILRFERMLKESLLEGYITSTTLEKISQEFHIADIRNLDIPETKTIRTLFGEESAQLLAKHEAPPTEVEPYPVPEKVEEVPTPIVPPPEVPPAPEPVTAMPTPPSPEPAPKISFSFPETPSEPAPQPPSQTPSQPVAPLSPPTIPKISFPTESKPEATPPDNPLTAIRGHREEDRATGIAILRKQMLTELKKIRSVVSEQDQ
jgi:hypothetical protein